MTSYIKIDQPEIIALLFPPQNRDLTPSPANAEDVSFETDTGISLNCRFYFSDLEAPTIFFFPSTSESVSSFDAVAEKYLQQGMNIFLASYRGCHENSGTASVSAMYADSEKLFHLATAWLKDKGYKGHLFVMGQSLGSVCAIDLVVNNNDLVKGLIIESGICDTAGFLEAIGADLRANDISEEEGFNNIEKIEKIKNPTLIFHGARDALVAIAEAENLQASSGARTKQFFVIPGAEHHSVSETGGDLYTKTIKQFTDTVCGVNTWRQKRRSHKRNEKR